MNKTYLYLILLSIVSCQSGQEEARQDKDSPTRGSTEIIIPTKEVRIDTLLNTVDYLVLGKKAGKVKVVKEVQLADYPGFEVIIGYKDDLVIAENLTYDDMMVYRKYNPASSFEDYFVEIYTGKLAEPDFSTDPDAKRFITRIKNECEKGVNFAGHYTLVIWGCGSSCQSGVVVNRKTGAIYGGYGTALGADFREDSKLLVRNVEAIDTLTNLIRVCAYCDVNHEIWTGTAFEEVE